MSTKEKQVPRPIRMAPVRNKTGLSHGSVYAQMEKGLLPSSIKISEKSVAWLEHEIDEVVKARIIGKSDSEIRTLVKKLEADRAALAA